MKKNYLLLVAAFSCLIRNVNAQSPDWLWAKAMGAISDDYSNSITTDASGNVYTAGKFSGTVDFDPGAGTFYLTSTGYSIFISKLDALGNFVWAKAMGAAMDAEAFSIVIDSPGSGDIYTTGGFLGTVDFDPGAGTYNLTSAGFSDIFVSKLDSSGNFVWAKAMSGTGNDYGYSIALDPTGSGGVYTTGYFLGTVDFDPGGGVFNLTSSGIYDIFISKLDASGNFVWAKAMGGTLSDYSQSIALDPAGSGDVYTTGGFNGTADFDPGAGVFNLTSAGALDVFISKLDSSGNFIWAKQIGGADIDYSFSIAIDPTGSGDIYPSGHFTGTVDLDPGAGTFNLTAAGGADIFISKLDAAGNFVWAKAIGGTGYDFCYSIAFAPSGSGSISATGIFEGTADFDPGAGTFNLTSSGYRDIFICKLNSSGNFVWAKSAGGADEDTGGSLAIDASGNAYVTGHFISPSVTFSPTTLINADNSGYTSDIFIARLDISTATGNNEIESFGNGILLFPNPAANHFTIALGSNNKQVEVTITDITGKIIYTTAATETQKIEVNLPTIIGTGVYVVQIQTRDSLETKRLIVVK